MNMRMRPSWSFFQTTSRSPYQILRSCLLWSVSWCYQRSVCFPAWSCEGGLVRGSRTWLDVLDVGLAPDTTVCTLAVLWLPFLCSLYVQSLCASSKCSVFRVLWSSTDKTPGFCMLCSTLFHACAFSSLFWFIQFVNCHFWLLWLFCVCMTCL